MRQNIDEFVKEIEVKESGTNRAMIVSYTFKRMPDGYYTCTKIHGSERYLDGEKK
jgi:hypothetical protein